MSISEERLQILKMVEKGQISAAEASSLIEALGENEKLHSIPKTKKVDGKVLKVRVYEGNEDIKVNVNVPLKLVQVLADIGIRFLPEDKYPELKQLNIGDGTKVEVFVE